MAEDETALAIAQVHAVAPAEPPIATVLAVVLAHPVALAIGQITVLPYVHEVVVIDIALMIVGTDAGTGGDGAVGHHGAYRHTCLTVEKHIANLTFVTTQETLAAIRGIDAALLTCLTDEVEHPPILFVADFHHGVAGSTAYGEDGIDAPIADALADEIVAHERQLLVIALVDTGDDIGIDLRILHEEV